MRKKNLNAAAKRQSTPVHLQAHSTDTPRSSDSSASTVHTDQTQWFLFCKNARLVGLLRAQSQHHIGSTTVKYRHVLVQVQCPLRVDGPHELEAKLLQLQLQRR